METQTLFEAICHKLSTEIEGVTAGKMMSAPAMTYRDKVFAFYSGRHKNMVFRLGREFKPEDAGISEYTLLNPFKNKPPMAAWFHIPAEEHWEELARLALEKMKQKKEQK